MDVVTGYWLMAAVVCLVVGALVGKTKQRTAAGAIWGFVLGPIGWLLVALGPDAAQRQAKRCPHCLGLVPLNQSACAHCNRALVWVRGEPRKPSGSATVIGH